MDHQKQLDLLAAWWNGEANWDLLVIADGSLTGSEKPPVVVLIEALTWQHSGANIIDASVLATRGRLMVATVNFRLGVLGEFTIYYGLG